MPTPVMHYIVQCQWPYRRGVWRTAMKTGNPDEARRSVETLVEMRHRARVLFTLQVPGSTKTIQSRAYPLAEWSNSGAHQLLHHSRALRRVPAWFLGHEESEPAGSAGARSSHASSA